MYNLINNNLSISVNIIIFFFYKNIIIAKERFKNIFYFQTFIITEYLITLRGITEL